MRALPRASATAMALLAAGLAGCGAPQPAQLEAVAESGVKFAQSVPPLLDTALSEAISANSATLVMEHATASEDARKTALLAADSAYRERAKIFADVSTHALLLKRGEVAATGRLEQVLTSRRLSEAFEARVRLSGRKGRYGMVVTPRRGVVT